MTTPSQTHRRWLASALLVLGTVAVVLAGSTHVAAGQKTPVEELVIVDADIDGRDVTVTVVAPADLRDADVNENSFLVTMDGVEIMPTVERVSGDDLDVVLLVDVSGSMSAEALAAAKSAASLFLAQIPPNTRVSIVSFGDETLLVQPFTTDVGLATSKLSELVAGGETALYQGVVAAARQFDPSVDSIRTVVLLSDGGNTVEEGTLGGAQLALQLTNATLHAISIETDEANPAELDELAEATGGTVARVEQVVAIEELYRSIAVDLGNQYRLGWTAVGHGQTGATVQARSTAGEPLAETTFTLSLPLAVPTPRPERAPVVPAPVEAPPAPTVLEATAPRAATIEASNPLWMKWGAIGSMGIAIAIIAGLLLVPSKRTRRLKPKSRFTAASVRQGGVGGAVRAMSDLLTSGVERVLGQNRLGVWLSMVLDTAGWKIRNSEFVVLVSLFMTVAFFGGALSSIALGLSLAALVLLAVVAVLALLVKSRRDAFAEQLNTTFQMMAGALRTGYSLPQVFTLVANEAAVPTNEEFSRAVVETRLGRDLVDAAMSVAKRMKSTDFAWATTAIEISRDVGGDLSEVLDNVAATIRTRARVRRQIVALSAEGRVSAWILMALPFPLFFWQLLVNRDYTLLLFTTTLGRLIFFGAIAALIAGGFWMRKIIQVKY